MEAETVTKKSKIKVDSACAQMLAHGSLSCKLCDPKSLQTFVNLINIAS